MLEVFEVFSPRVVLQTEPKKTPLYEEHVRLGARMVEFSGWWMPLQYGDGIIKEHEFVRSERGAGVFDISHMGEFHLEGEVVPFLQYMMTNDLRLLENGKSQYSCMCYENGTVVDDLTYYQLRPDDFEMIVNAGNVDKDFEWLRDHLLDHDVTITDHSNMRARIAIQGPRTLALLDDLVDVDLTRLKRFYFTSGHLDDVEVFIAGTGYTGEHGFEMSMERDDVVQVWRTLLDAGAKPVGLGARDSLRLEACYSLYGHEISDEITPVEAGIGWVVKPKEGIDFVGKEVLLRQKREGTTRTLVGLNMLDPGVIRAECKLYHAGKEVGHVTSGTYAPHLEKTVGLALVQTALSAVGTELEIDIRGRRKRVVVVKTPFYRNV